MCTATEKHSSRGDGPAGADVVVRVRDVVVESSAAVVVELADGAAVVVVDEGVSSGAVVVVVAWVVVGAALHEVGRGGDQQRAARTLALALEGDEGRTWWS